LAQGVLFCARVVRLIVTWHLQTLWIRANGGHCGGPGPQDLH